MLACGGLMGQNNTAMKGFIKSGVLAAVAWVLSSCGTQVYLETWQPAQVNLQRGTVLRVYPEARGPLNYELRRAFEHQIAKDGYYQLYGSGPSADIRLHRVDVSYTDPPRDDKKRRRPYPNRVELRADVMSYYQRLYSRDVSSYVSCDLDDHPDWESAAENIAEDVMRDLTPHRVRYSESVDGVDNNPSVELAARACAAGNWEGGRSYAQQALSLNPNEAEAYFVLGLIERNARNYAASDDYFRKAHSLKPDGKYASAVNDNVRLQRNESQAQSQLQGM